MPQKTRMEIMTDFSLLSSHQKNWVKRNRKGTHFIGIVFGRQLVSAINYSFTGPDSVLIHFAGHTRKIPGEFRARELFPEEYLFEQLIRKGVHGFSYEKIRKVHYPMIERWAEQGLIEYDKEWNFRVTEQGKKIILRNKNHFVEERIMPKKKPVIRQKKPARKLTGKIPKPRRLL